MNLPGERPNLIRVGRFELDRRSRELCGGLARVRLQYLVDHFPQSEEAPLAKERLAALK